MDTKKVFEKFNNFIVSKSVYNELDGKMKLQLTNPEDDSVHEVIFKQITFYNFLIDEATHKIQEQEDLPRAFLEINSESENLGVTKHKQDWFKAVDFAFNTRVVYSDGVVLLKAGAIELDGIDVDAYPEEVDQGDELSVFYTDEELDELEHNGQWEESVVYLKKLWEETPSQRNLLYRYAVQNWYAFTYKEQSGIESKEQRNALKANLKEAHNYAKEHCWSDSNCLWLFGYMMETNPFAFVSVITYIDETKMNGRKLINDAAEMEPENLLAQVEQLAEDKKMIYKKKKKQLAPNLREYFPSNSAVDKYFLEHFES